MKVDGIFIAIGHKPFDHRFQRDMWKWMTRVIS
jgi:hypothetical protein